MTNAKESIEVFSDLNNKSFEVAQRLSEINLRTMEKMVCRQMDVMNMFMESSLRQAKITSESKGYNDLIKGQIELAKEVTERVMNESRENVKIASDTRDEYRAWIEQGMEVVTENVHKAQEAAK